ncbi:DNA-directed RNA polymerase [Candidatus Woesearchaeota archaeon]|nr:DNA-directed RNA polymerase [Candidatus Woesearchaeota archaeon]
MKSFSKGGPRRDNNGPRRDSGFRNNNFGQREMHKAVCSECGNECEVPFKPTEGKPVYCRECFRKKRSF